jgi:hypothetical protein
MGRGSDPGVLVCLLQGLLAAPLDAGQIEPADRGQVKEDAGAAGARRGDRLLQQCRRAGRVAGVEGVLGPPQAGRCPIPSCRRRNHSYGERPNVASALTG